MAIQPLQIVVPMAGRGARFADAGFERPKPLISVNGRPMIDLVVDNLRPTRDHRFIFLVRREHLSDRTLGLKESLSKICEEPTLVSVDGITDGAACTVLCARHEIDMNAPLMIANSDQWFATSIDAFLESADDRDADGLIMTMTANGAKWSYVSKGDDGRVVEVAEKREISDTATVGVYHFARGRAFVEAADAMIHADERVNGEFYVAPVYNYLIKEGASIYSFDAGVVEKDVFGLGTPEDLEIFLSAVDA